MFIAYAIVRFSSDAGVFEQVQAAVCSVSRLVVMSRVGGTPHAGFGLFCDPASA